MTDNVDNTMDNTIPTVVEEPKKLKGFQSGPDWNGNALGRPKGSGNKIAESTKAAMLEVFESLNPAELLHDWALNRPELFQRMWKHMLPKNILIEADIRKWEKIQIVAYDATNPKGSDSTETPPPDKAE